MDEIFAAYCLKNIGDKLSPRRVNYFKLQQVNIVIFTTSFFRISDSDITPKNKNDKTTRILL
jgi:hypothetical protein